jgi:hypothetical protein
MPGSENGAVLRGGRRRLRGPNEIGVDPFADAGLPVGTFVGPKASGFVAQLLEAHTHAAFAGFVTRELVTTVAAESSQGLLGHSVSGRSSLGMRPRSKGYATRHACARCGMVGRGAVRAGP